MFWLSPRVCQVSFQSRGAYRPRGAIDRLRKSVCFLDELPLVKENGLGPARLTQFARGAERAPRRARTPRKRRRCAVPPPNKPGRVERFRTTIIIGYKVIPGRSTCIVKINAWRVSSSCLPEWRANEKKRAPSSLLFPPRLIRRAVIMRAVIQRPC